MAILNDTIYSYSISIRRSVAFFSKGFLTHPILDVDRSWQIVTIVKKVQISSTGKSPNHRRQKNESVYYADHDRTLIMYLALNIEIEWKGIAWWKSRKLQFS